MRHTTSKTAKIVMALVLVSAAVTAAIYPSVAAQSPPKFTIIMTSSGVSATPEAPQGGDYLLVVKNHTKQPRGILMTGKDKAGSPYVRFSKVLPSGAYETFRWYFPEQKTVLIRDMLSCKRDDKGCIKTTTGNMKKYVKFE